MNWTWNKKELTWHRQHLRILSPQCHKHLETVKQRTQKIIYLTHEFITPQRPYQAKTNLFVIPTTIDFTNSQVTPNETDNSKLKANDMTKVNMYTFESPQTRSNLLGFRQTSMNWVLQLNKTQSYVNVQSVLLIALQQEPGPVLDIHGITYSKQCTPYVTPKCEIFGSHGSNVKIQQG